MSELRTYKLNDAEASLLFTINLEDESSRKQLTIARMALDLKVRIASDFTDAERGLVAAVYIEAQSRGRLIYQPKRISFCTICKKSGGYATYKQSSGWHKKGEKNLSKPLSIDGVEMARRFVIMDTHATLGCCSECFNKLQPLLAIMLADVRAEMPEKITNIPPRFKWWNIRHCTKCEWTGSEEEMGEDYALMGGKYRSTCPNCGVKNLAFGKMFVTVVTDEFALSEVTPA